MKYQIEFFPNPHCVRIHVSQRLTRGTILFDGYMGVFEPGQEEFKKEEINEQRLFNFCKVVDELDGIERGISLGRYHVEMLKASDMFSWDDILPHVLNALQTFVAADGTIEESAPPKLPTPEELSCLERDMLEFSRLMNFD